MQQITIRQFHQSRPPCSVPLGYEFKRWFAAPLTKRQNDIISLLEYHRVERRRAPYLIIHDPHNRQDIHQIVRAYLQWRNEQTVPGLRAALITPKRTDYQHGCMDVPSARIKKSPAGQSPIKHFSARNYRAAHGQTFGMVAALNCHLYCPKREPEDGFADFPSIFISMLDRTSPHHLLILHGCIPQTYPHSFGRFMAAAAKQDAPYLIYDCVSRSFLTPEPLRKSPKPQLFDKADAIHRVTEARPPSPPAPINSKPSLVGRVWEGLPGLPGLPLMRECRPRRPKRNCPARGRELACKQRCLSGGYAISPTLTSLTIHSF